jgi:hypothetical protein
VAQAVACHASLDFGSRAMPRRRNRTGVVTNSPRSASASPESAVSHQEFKELKESVQSIFARLEVLERVFVFVDIEEINTVIAKYHSDVPSPDRAGIDSALACSKWEAFPAGRMRLYPCIPEEASDSSDKVSHDMLEGKDCGGYQSVHHLAERLVRQPESIVDAQSLSAPSIRCDMECGMVSDASEVKHCIWDVPISAHDEDEQKSNCSTWDLCSTRDGLDAEADIEPELFHKFMKQALRPQWEMRVNGSEAVTAAGTPARSSGVISGEVASSSTCESHADHGEMTAHSGASTVDFKPLTTSYTFDQEGL